MSQFAAVCFDTQRLESSATRPNLLLFCLVATYIVLLPIQIETGGVIPDRAAGFRFAPSDIFLILYALVAALSLKPYRPRVWNMWHLAILFSFALATLNAQIRHGETSQYVILNKDIGLLVLFVTYAMLTTEAATFGDIRRILKVFVCAVAVLNTLALVSFFNLVPWLAENVFTLPYTGRLSGMLIDPNAYGGLLSVTFAIQGNTYFSRRPLIGGVVGLYILVSLLTGVLYTYSRSAWIGVVVMVAILCVVRPKVGIISLLLIGMGLTGIVTLLDQSSLDSMVYMASRPSQVDSRLDTMAHAVPQFLDNPLIGVGLGSFARDYGIIIHNTPLWFLTEFGLVGFISFAGLYSWFLLNGYRAYKLADEDQRPVILGLLVAHIAMLGLSMGIEVLYQRHWWLVMAMIASAIVAIKTDPRSTRRQ